MIKNLVYWFSSESHSIIPPILTNPELCTNPISAILALALTYALKIVATKISVGNDDFPKEYSLMLLILSTL